ncbi:MAG: putative 2OG-Fe(II) oxygenase [Chakrabartia sp.]
MTFQRKIAAVRLGQANSNDLADLARLAIQERAEEQALPYLQKAAAAASDARLWQWSGLLERALDEHGDALTSFFHAARLAPMDASIAHGHARVALEAGIDAVALFDHARRLAPSNGEVLLGQAAARLAVGRGEEAAAEIDAILIQEPRWVQGHHQLAQLRSMLGRPEDAILSLDRALTALPGHADLWQARCDLDLRREEYGALQDSVERAKARGCNEAFLAEYETIAASEGGDIDRADILFAAMPNLLRPKLALWHIRHLLRAGRIDDAIKYIDSELQTDRAAAVWPYAATAWRLAGDPRSAWLESDPRFVSVVNLKKDLPKLDALATVLRALHVAKGEYLDQSVRGGTQTDGPLLSRIDPEIRAVREAIFKAVEHYIGQLPERDDAHPLLAGRRDRRVRFAGSWSVRLRGAGHHTNHVHPQGWISSALYVSLPQHTDNDAPDAGWLTLGEPQAALGLSLPPTRMIEPREGQLVLFPSWMWHGTRPFSEGERLTIAFDVAPA